MIAPGVSYFPEFWTESQRLLERLLAEVVWDSRLGARQTASFGAPYNYSQMTYPEAPLPHCLTPLVDRLKTTLGYRPNNCLANLYRDGRSTMGFHRDATDGFAPGTGVAIVSLGATRTLTFRRIDDRNVQVHFELMAGSLLYMPLEVQDDWQHAVGKSDTTEPRVSLTFRRLLV